MLRTLIGLLPLAAGVAAYGLVTWYTLSRGMAIGTWLVVALLVGHGWVHMMYAFPSPAATDPAAATYPFDISGSWLVSAGLDLGLVKPLILALGAAVMIGFVLAGLATMGWLVPAGWWPVLVAVSSLLSIAVLVLTLNVSFVIGYAIDAVLLWVVVASTWRPGAAAALG